LIETATSIGQRCVTVIPSLLRGLSRDRPIWIIWIGKESRRDLHNALFDAGLISWLDIQQKQGLPGLILGVTRTRLINLYREAEMADYAKTGFSRVFLIDGGARPDHAPIYQSCLRAGGFPKDTGTLPLSIALAQLRMTSLLRVDSLSRSGRTGYYFTHGTTIWLT